MTTFHGFIRLVGYSSAGKGDFSRIEVFAAGRFRFWKPRPRSPESVYCVENQRNLKKWLIDSRMGGDCTILKKGIPITTTR
ncbi:hypothetical protein EON65_01360 [archaeon]|nr:MAG: hypothetical protein EON65_01360 [archaeon]